MALNRREFLKLIGASAVISALPIFQSTREPYVTENSGAVSYVGANGKGFIGAQLVKKVHPFDGVGYPVEVSYGGYHSRIEKYYDFDLCDMGKELPDKFWWNEENNKKYPNVHTYIREKRFGETVGTNL